MTGREVPIGAALTFAWETFKANFLFLVGLFFAVFLIAAFVNVAGEYDTVDTWFSRFAIEAISALVEIVLDMGLIVIALKLVGGEKPEFADLFSRITFVFHYLAAAVIVGVMVVLGLVLFIVPAQTVNISVGPCTSNVNSSRRTSANETVLRDLPNGKRRRVSTISRAGSSNVTSTRPERVTIRPISSRDGSVPGCRPPGAPSSTTSRPYASATAPASVPAHSRSFSLIVRSPPPS